MYYIFCREVRGAKLVCHRKPLRGLTALGKDTCTKSTIKLKVDFLNVFKTKTVFRMCSFTKVFLKILQNSLGNVFVGVIKFQLEFY